MNEHAKNLIVSATAAVPILGGSISVLIDKYLPSALAKRRDLLIEKIDQDIEFIKEQIQPGKLETEEYITIFFKVFKAAIEEHAEEKIKYFRGILQNCVLSKDLENPEIELYIKLVSELTISHMKILTLVQNNDFNEKIFYIHVTDNEDYSLQRYCVSDLEGKQLIWKGHVLEPYTLTNLGKRFLKFITLYEGSKK